MATLYPFRIEVTYKNGDTLGFFTESLARDTEPVISASIMNSKIDCMPRATIIGLSGSAISGGYLGVERIDDDNGHEDGDAMNLGNSQVASFGDHEAGDNPGLSCSFDDPSTGSLFFHDTESTAFGGLDFYTFHGTKVCSVLGLPEGIPIYTENFKLSDDSTDPTNYLSGDVIADGVAVKQSFKLAPQARLKSNLVWDKENGEGLLQWVSGSSTELLFGYDKNDDKYVLAAAATPTFAISGVDTLSTAAASITTMTAGDVITATIKAPGGNLLIGEDSIINTYGEDGTTSLNRFFGRTTIQLDNTTTFANTATNSLFQLILQNNTDTSAAFAGIAFQVEAGFNEDRLNAAIFAERVDGGAGKVDSDLVFATNNDADDDLFERMRIHSDGEITAPAQPCFHAHAATAQTDGGNTTTTTVVFGTERTDAGSNFASNTFTAPVAGTYFLQTTLDIRSIPSTTDYFWAKIITSNETYYGDIIRIDDIANAEVAYFTYSCTAIADMDASDTATVGLQSANAGTSWTIHGVGGQPHSFFQGHLIG